MYFFEAPMQLYNVFMNSTYRTAGFVKKHPEIIWAGIAGGLAASHFLITSRTLDQILLYK